MGINNMKYLLIIVLIFCSKCAKMPCHTYNDSISICRDKVLWKYRDTFTGVDYDYLKTRKK